VEQAEQQTLHPFFDHCDDLVWLTCEVLETDPISLRFHAAPPVEWPDLKRARVANHFRVLDLGMLYAIHGATELTGRRAFFEGVASKDGAAGLASLLSSEASSRLSSERNSWQGALYTGLAMSDWFCNGGYKRIPEPAR
jgi:hypothetical protein